MLILQLPSEASEMGVSTEIVRGYEKTGHICKKSHLRYPTLLTKTVYSSKPVATLQNALSQMSDQALNIQLNKI